MVGGFGGESRDIVLEDLLSHAFDEIAEFSCGLTRVEAAAQDFPYLHCSTLGFPTFQIGC